MFINDVYTYCVYFKSGERTINKVVVFMEDYSKKEIEAIITTRFNQVTSVESINVLERASYIGVVK